MNLEIFKKRREKFFEMMGEGVAIFLAAPSYMRNQDINHPYRQESDFYYLTGFEEPEACFVLTQKNGEKKFTFFLRERDPEEEVWKGKRAGVEGGKEIFGADESYPIGKIYETLPKLLTNQNILYFSLGRHPDFDKSLIQIINSLKREIRKGTYGPWQIVDPALILWKMRLKKDEEEIKNLRESCRIASIAIKDGMKNAKAGMFEYEIQAIVEYNFYKNGVRRCGFETIIAAGNNATVLHYIQNNKRIENGELLLIDAGCEYNYVSADITRTFPPSGKFSSAQREVYAIVLETQKKIISMIKEGIKYKEIQDKSIYLLTEGMLELGLLKGNINEIIEKGEFKKFYPHRFGHFLGMDVHDPALYFKDNEWIGIEKGVVLTVEPGLYIPETTENIPPEFKGIGIRIEDDIYFGENGVEILTSEVPKEINELEDFTQF